MPWPWERVCIACDSSPHPNSRGMQCYPPMQVSGLGDSFLQAALICCSTSLVFSAVCCTEAVMLNQRYLLASGVDHHTSIQAVSIICADLCCAPVQGQGGTSLHVLYSYEIMCASCCRHTARVVLQSQVYSLLACNTCNGTSLGSQSLKITHIHDTAQSAHSCTTPKAHLNPSALHL